MNRFYSKTFNPKKKKKFHFEYFLNIPPAPSLLMNKRRHENTSLLLQKIRKMEETNWNLDLVLLILIVSKLIEIPDVTKTTSTVLHDRDGGPPSLPCFK